MKPVYLLILVSAAAALGIAAGALIVKEPDFHAIVERDGTVLLCVSKGQILFSDRCAGSGRLTIVQPIQEGPITWRTASGKVEFGSEWEQHPLCAVSRATWDPKSERAVPTGQRIGKLDHAAIAFSNFPSPDEFRLGDLTGYSLDLNHDGADEIVFVFDSVAHASAGFEKTRQPARYIIAGGILSGNLAAAYPNFFRYDPGSYDGPTDMIVMSRLVGVLPLASDEIAIMVIGSSDHHREIIRFKDGPQRIQVIHRRCD